MDVEKAVATRSYNDPARQLVAAILLRAIRDAKSKKPELAAEARGWLLSSPLARYFLGVLGIKWRHIVTYVVGLPPLPLPGRN